MIQETALPSRGPHAQAEIKSLLVPEPADAPLRYQFLVIADSLAEGEKLPPDLYNAVQSFFTAAAQNNPDQTTVQSITQAWNCIAWNMAGRLGGDILSDKPGATAFQEPSRFSPKVQEEALRRHKRAVLSLEPDNHDVSDVDRRVTAAVCKALAELDLHPFQEAFDATANAGEEERRIDLWQRSLDLKLDTTPKAVEAFWNRARCAAERATSHELEKLNPHHLVVYPPKTHRVFYPN